MQQITGSDILNTRSYSPGRILELIPGNLGMIFMNIIHTRLNWWLRLDQKNIK